MLYYQVKSSHWPGTYEFRSEIKLEEGQCFRILSNDLGRFYPTRFKVLAVNETPSTPIHIVTIKDVDTAVEPFE